MEILSLSQKQLDKLKKLPLPNGVFNDESEIYIMDNRKCLGKEKLLLKKLFITKGDCIANKLYNISLLGDNKDKIGIDELVIPNYLVAIKRKIEAFTVPLIEGENLGIIINNPKISNEKKLDYLYKVGRLIKKTQKLEDKGIKFNFGDLHEYNFMVGKDDKTYAIDLDGSYLNTANPQPSKYLIENPNLGLFPTKYIGTVYGLIFPDNNSDLLCYNMMLLNTIGRSKVSKMNIATYYEYINYLKSLGFGSDIIESFNRVYSTADNINPCEYLDQIPNDKIGEAGVKIFKYKKSRGKI